ncbi:helix-turn-helix transcriptional regulator [Pseudomonas sp.]
MSDKTGMALSTTKWHLKNIYSKLNVSTRTEAILAVRPRHSLHS